MKKLLLIASVAFGAVALARGVQAFLSNPAQAVVSYYGDGRPRSSTTFLDGAKHGPYEAWHPSGSKECEGQFEAGLREGYWRFWNDDGTTDTERTGHYRAGRRESAG